MTDRKFFLTLLLLLAACDKPHIADPEQVKKDFLDCAKNIPAEEFVKNNSDWINVPTRCLRGARDAGRARHTLSEPPTKEKNDG